jgi:hypothetical protein
MRSDTLHFPDAIDLTGLFMIAWPLVDRTLAEDALAALPHVGVGLPPERAREEAVLWIWQEDLAVIDTSGLAVLQLPPDGRVEDAQRVPLSPWAFEGPEVRAFLRGLPGAYSPISHTRLMIEVRAQRVLAWIAEQVRAGALGFEATHPRTHQRFEPDPTLIEGLFGLNRWRGQIPTDTGTISGLRFYCCKSPAEPDPAQGDLVLEPHQVIPKADVEQHSVPPPPAAIEANRWSVIWEKYADHVRDIREQHGRLPKIAEDYEWRDKPEIGVTRDEVRELRRFREQAPSKNNTKPC